MLRSFSRRSRGSLLLVLDDDLKVNIFKRIITLVVNYDHELGYKTPQPVNVGEAIPC